MWKACCVALLVLPGVASAQLIFQDDFSDNDDQWLRVDFIGGTSYTVDGTYRIVSPPLPPVDAFALAGSAVIASASDPAFANGVLRTKVRLNNGATNAALVARVSAITNTGYTFVINSGGLGQDYVGIGILGGSNIAVERAPLSIDVGAEYFMEATFFGDALGLKVWRADEVEPSDPQVTWTDGSFDAGMVGVGVYNQRLSEGGTGGALNGSFDDFSFAIPGPSAAMVATMFLALAARRRRG